jgi:hypothetical protein
MSGAGFEAPASSLLVAWSIASSASIARRNVSSSALEALLASTTSRPDCFTRRSSSRAPSKAGTRSIHLP